MSSKRQRRLSKTVATDSAGGMDIDSPENSTGSNEAARSLGSTNGLSSGSTAGNLALTNGLGMGQRPMIGTGMMGLAGGQSGPVANSAGASSGPQEWEWLTMSL